MPTQWKKAEYKGNKNSPFESKRAEFYRVTDGFTVGNRVCYDGEIFHISELDTEDAAGEKVESFRPLTLPEQVNRFGRIMYHPYEPTEEELEMLGWEREDVRVDEGEASQQRDAQFEEDFEGRVKTMPEEMLREEARIRFGLEFPEDMPERRMRQAILRRFRDQQSGEQFDPGETNQMASNTAQREGK